VKDTIAYYERSAREYAKEIDPLPPANRAAALRRLMALVPPGGVVMEIGSGTGRDADYLESLGATVRRTDAAQSFADIQAERGKRVALVDVVADELGGPYDAVLAMCVLMHVERGQIDGVLRKVAAALRPGGAFLLSVRDGQGESIGPAGMAFWSRSDFADRLAAAGFSVEWDDHHVDCDDDAWLTFLVATR
jgi:2-polyprenyl-3-methyl-5-hydroxy-6-metoxy-1,4-benzoquinol methylase